jgi:cbb3-type cytochrome oxidase subunit 1
MKMGVVLIKIAVVYFLVGITFGLFMSAFHVFDLATVHVHINLLGWMSLSIIGIIYILVPALGKTTAAKVHFWLHNIGLPMMMISIAIAILGGSEVFFPLATIGGALTVIGIFFFGYNVLKHLSSGVN